MTSGEANIGTSKAVVKSLVMVEGINSKLIVDGEYFMTLASGAIEGWIY